MRLNMCLLCRLCTLVQRSMRRSHWNICRSSVSRWLILNFEYRAVCAYHYGRLFDIRRWAVTVCVE